MLNKGVAALVTGFVLIIASLGVRPTNALTISGARDCDTNAVINCGLANSKDMVADFQSSSVKNIYSYFGISRADINNFDSQAVAGSVTRHNAVVVNGKIVATNAITGGRQYMPGSTTVTRGSVTFYVRPPSVSFQQPSLPAYVVMRDGRFAYAIIASCGNAVKATPVAKPKKHKPPVPPTTPPTTPPQTPTPPTLPNTGPGDVVGIGGLTAAASGLGHFLYTRRKNP